MAILKVIYHQKIMGGKIHLKYIQKFQYRNQIKSRNFDCIIQPKVL